MVLVVVLVAGVFMVAPLGHKPMGTDLAVVGQGRPVLVLGYQNYSPTAGDALDRLSRVRGDYEDSILFVAADLGTPHGQKFAKRFNLGEGLAVLLDPNGGPIAMLDSPADEQALRQKLDRHLASLVDG